MNIKKVLSVLCVSASLLISSAAVYAEDIKIETSVPQPDEICGYINLHPSTESDVYIKIYKNTPDTERDNYVVYDTVIKADTVHAADNYVFELEYNNLNFEKGTYEGNYEIEVGVDKLLSPEAEEIVYTTLNLVVEDENFCGSETFCNININVTDEFLEQPVCNESGDKYNKTYDLTFSTMSIIIGDANKDGKINVRDCAFIASKLAQGKSEELTAESDVNLDSKINVRDAAALALSLAGGGSKPEPTNPTSPTDPAITTEPVDSTEESTESTDTTDIPDSTEVTDATEATDPTEPPITSTP